jgi:hypothetical protein
METRFIALCISIILLLGSGGASSADSLNDTFEADKAGDVQTALGIVTPLAEQGDALAQNNLVAMHKPHHGMQSRRQPKRNGLHKHDRVNMPGLQGRDTTDQEVNDLTKIFRSHKGIARVFTNIEDGIITVTEANDETLRDAIVSHVSMMVTRLQEGKNSEVIIQSPTLDALFDFYDEIETEIEQTDFGIKVIQTSANQEVVTLLQKHAAEVSDMSERGMQAVHERMANQNH